jgi:polyisoprenoid-binding protein YceI
MMIRKSILTMALLAAPLLQAAEYQIDPAHSAAHFTVRHMMVSNVRGDFSKVTGTIVYDEKNPAATRIDATIDATTVNTSEPKRDAHLKSADFLDVTKYPVMTFKSKRVKVTADGLAVTGDLTIHGVTREVVLNVEKPSAELKDGKGGARRGATATTKINRKDFGLTWNMAIEAGGVAVGEEVAIVIDIEATRPGPQG